MSHFISKGSGFTSPKQIEDQRLSTSAQAPAQSVTQGTAASEIANAGTTPAGMNDEDFQKLIQRLGLDQPREMAAATSDLFSMTNVIRGGASPYEGVALQQSVNAMESLLRKVIPTDRQSCIAHAQGWSESDDLLSRIISVYMTFTMTGMGFHIVESGTSQSSKPVTGETKPEDIPEDQYAEATQFLRQFDRRYKLGKVITDLIRDYRITDTMILYWKMKTKSSMVSESTEVTSPPLPASPYEDLVPDLIDISALNPADVTWNNSLGMDILSVRIPVELRDRVKKALANDEHLAVSKTRTTPTATYKIGPHVESVVQSGVSLRWVDEIAMGRSEVQLLHEEGDHWIIRTKQRKHHGLATPSMKSIFMPLQTRQLLSDGEFAAAWVTKHFIMLIQGGESINQGPMSGSRNNYLTQGEADTLNDKFKDASKAMKVVVNHTVKISFVFPPKEFFNREKFQNCESRIFNWGDVTLAIMEGQGDSYASGFIGVKRLLSRIACDRFDVGEMVTEFFDHPTIRNSIDIKETADVAVSFDEQVLKEPQQLLREIEFLFKNCIIDHRTAASELGRNPDRLRQSKRRTRAEDQQDGSWSPVNNQAETADTSSVVDKGGRPANPGTTQNPETRMQTGSPGS